MEDTPVDLATLRSLSPDELEAQFAHDAPFEVPTGLFRGVYLRGIAPVWARRLDYRLLQFAGFRHLPFWVDFDRCLWAFVSPRLATGRFTPTAGPSRWRDTEVVRLSYEVSRLPGPIRGLLYDEVKPISRDLLLGMGGVNREKGTGELFFFALVPDRS